MARPRIRAMARVRLAAAAGAAQTPAAADQKDSRLDALFARLLESPGPVEAQQVEGRIWQTWMQSDDGAVQGLMRDGVDAMARGDYTQALAKFDQMVVIAPDLAEGWNERAKTGRAHV